MKIEYRNGDLFSTKIQTIVHGCNAQGVMGSGVAKIIRDEYPRAYDRYRNEYERESRLKLGSIITVPCRDHTNPDIARVIINAITQEFYGGDPSRRYVSYDAVSDAMKMVDRLYDVYGITTIAMPKIGAGLGGGDWNVIASIIESELTNITPVVYTI
jgi:O-acetyl-ADP-ribose deacetylase (regulator of RNase III)